MNRWTDPIVEEVHQAREQHAAKFDYDIGRIVADVREQESTRVIVAAPEASVGRQAADAKARAGD